MTSWEVEANRLVAEYLIQNGYRTATTFRDECRQRGGLPENSELDGRRQEMETSRLIDEFLSAFEVGDREQYFMLWKRNIPAGVLEKDTTCLQLEFKAQLSFAVYPLKRGLNSKSEEYQQSISHFKSVLESSGPAYEQLNDFISYGALPFVPDPRQVPAFKSLFSPSWDGELKARLQHFLKSVLKPTSKPQLYYLITNSNLGVSTDTRVTALRQQAQEAEQKMLEYHRQVVRLQGDNQNILSVAVELVEALEATVKGQPLTTEHLQGLVGRIFGSDVQQSVDVGRPGTASALLRASLHATNVHIMKSREVPLLPSLDCGKIKADWKILDERHKVLLLHALRLRLTKSLAGEQRDTVITAYTQNDLLGAQESSDHQDTVLSSLRSRSALVREYTARIFNTFASLSTGRSYLCHYTPLIGVLHEVLVQEESDTAVRQNVLGTLQKLSLRQKLQTVMIEEGIIGWLISVLQDQESLSDYSLHYTSALLMNLCLRTSGKLRCVTVAGKVLKALNDLLEHEDVEVRSYVNGTLYSILAIPQIREEARAMGMEEILAVLVQSSEAGLASQLEYIIKQLKSDEVSDDVVSDDEGDDDDEEDPEALDIELDENLEMLGMRTGELTGERLLCEHYLGFMTSSMEVKPRKKLEPVSDSIPLQRPVTPRILGEPLSGGASHRGAANEPAEVASLPERDNTRPKTRSSRQNSRPTSSSSRVERPSSAQSKSRPGSNQVRRSSRTTPVSNPAVGIQPSVPVDLEASKLLSQAVGESATVAVAGAEPIPRPSDKAMKALEAQGISLDEYTTAFATRPKIPRSPRPLSNEEKPTSGGSLRPARSVSPPASRSRPSSTTNAARSSRPTSKQTGQGGAKRTSSRRRKNADT